MGSLHIVEVDGRGSISPARKRIRGKCVGEENRPDVQGSDCQVCRLPDVSADALTSRRGNQMEDSSAFIQHGTAMENVKSIRFVL